MDDFMRQLMRMLGGEPPKNPSFNSNDGFFTAHQLVREKSTELQPGHNGIVMGPIAQTCLEPMTKAMEEDPRLLYVITQQDPEHTTAWFIAAGVDHELVCDADAIEGVNDGYRSLLRCLMYTLPLTEEEMKTFNAFQKHMNPKLRTNDPLGEDRKTYAKFRELRKADYEWNRLKDIKAPEWEIDLAKKAADEARENLNKHIQSMHNCKTNHVDDEEDDDE